MIRKRGPAKKVPAKKVTVKDFWSNTVEGRRLRKASPHLLKSIGLRTTHTQ
jgi:hypothetical protein